MLLRAVLEGILGLPVILQQACRHLFTCLQGSPVVFVLAAAAVLLLVSLILIFNVCLARLFTVPGALILNLCSFWLLLRLVVRVLVFPGSILCWKRSTEGSYRVEMAKQFSHHLEHLHVFLLMTMGKPPSVTHNVTMEGAILGCMVVEGLARNFRVQQRDQVRFTAEQAQVRLLVQGVEAWLGEAKVSGQQGPVPLMDWMQRMAQSLVPVPLAYAVGSTKLGAESREDADACVEKVQQLIVILADLQRQPESCCANMRRFLRVPTVGSLHQLRAELLVRYSGRHCWVRRDGGVKIDAMFLSSSPGEGGGAAVEADGPLSEGLSSMKEDVPLKLPGEDGNAGPVVVWCNPNAAYYETMAYESHWLDFYLSQGCSVFLFNYCGFGRSSGSPTPDALAADGNAVVDFLRRRGFRHIGVHGRSIGGIAACSLAKANPDIVKLLVADRTFSTLSKAAQFTFGAWAAKGLALSATWADNSHNYLGARCYKVMLCDPKDATIPDLASLRTAVALEAQTQMQPSDRLALEEDKVQRLVEAWQFFDVLFGICERDGDSGSAGSQCQSCRTPAATGQRLARQPVVGKPASEMATLSEGGEEDTQRLVAAGREIAVSGGSVSRSSGASGHRTPQHGAVNAQWLGQNPDVARAAMRQHIDSVRMALDLAGTQFNASGMTLDEALGRPVDEAAYGLRCFLANLQVWGSLAVGGLQPLCAGYDRDLELLLQKGPVLPEAPELASRLARVSDGLTPEKLAAYGRKISRGLVASVRREFRQCLSQIQRALEAPAVQDDGPAADLRAAVLANLREVELLLTHIYRFFRCVDVAGAQSGGSPASGDLLGGSPPSASQAAGASGAASDDDSEVRESGLPPASPTLDRGVVGHVMCIDCGHNGALSDGELHQLTLHLRAAKFGKYAHDLNVP